MQNEVKESLFENKKKIKLKSKNIFFKQNAILPSPFIFPFNASTAYTAP